VWASSPGSTFTSDTGREAVLPTGAMHIAIRLSGSLLRVYRSVSDVEPLFTGYSVVGGAREQYYIRDIGDSGCSVGAVLQPHAATKLFGVPASELAGRHTDLSDLWGRDALLLKQQLEEILDPGDRLTRFEEVLWRKLCAIGSGCAAILADDVVRFALREWTRGSSVADVVRRSGYSHRHFVDRFRRAVGLSPKAWCRVSRFQQALRHVSSDRTSLCEIAHAHGYSDQAHFSREFQYFTGITPTLYRSLAPALQNHVVLSPLVKR
jgi:AraC-like DNA-binding protein